MYTLVSASELYIRLGFSISVRESGGLKLGSDASLKSTLVEETPIIEWDLENLRLYHILDILRISRNVLRAADYALDAIEHHCKPLVISCNLHSPQN